MSDKDANKDPVIGIDLGGTKILAGVYSPAMKCLGRAKKATKADNPTEAVIERIAKCAREAIEEAGVDRKSIRAAGIGAPSPVDPKTGLVLCAPNLDWQNVPLKKELEKLLGVPVFVENDCNQCLLGIHAVEFKGEPKSMVGIFVGTGIGGGLILDGELYQGRNGTAAELGHMVLQIDGPLLEDNIPGSLEAIASRTAIARRLRAAVLNGQDTMLKDVLLKDSKTLKSGDIRKAVEKGDALVRTAVEESAKAVGIAIGSLINVLTPEVVVLGGGLIEQLEKLMMPIIESNARRHAFDTMDKGTRIVASKLADDSGIVGGAVLALKNLD